MKNSAITSKIIHFFSGFIPQILVGFQLFKWMNTNSTFDWNLALPPSAHQVDRVALSKFELGSLFGMVKKLLVPSLFCQMHANACWMLPNRTQFSHYHQYSQSQMMMVELYSQTMIARVLKMIIAVIVDFGVLDIAADFTIVITVTEGDMEAEATKKIVNHDAILTKSVGAHVDQASVNEIVRG